jgi:hypothetical protein
LQIPIKTAIYGYRNTFADLYTQFLKDLLLLVLGILSREQQSDQQREKSLKSHEEINLEDDSSSLLVRSFMELKHANLSSWGKFAQDWLTSRY